MLNNFCAVGRLTKDPELRRTGSGTAVTSFNLAVNRSFKNQQGEYEADFIPCVVWNKSAENVAQYCSKGSLICIVARMQSRSYENNQGQKVFVLEAVCESVQFLETKKKEQQAQQQPQTNDFYSTQTNDLLNDFEHSTPLNIMEDDIQF